MDDNLYMHVVGPVLALISFVLCDRSIYISFPIMLTGMISVIEYSVLYVRNAIFKGPENGGWPDFYGFNATGKWYISLIAMYIATFIISVGISYLHNIMILSI